MKSIELGELTEKEQDMYDIIIEDNTGFFKLGWKTGIWISKYDTYIYLIPNQSSSFDIATIIRNLILLKNDKDLNKYASLEIAILNDQLCFINPNKIPEDILYTKEVPKQVETSMSKIQCILGLDSNKYLHSLGEYCYKIRGTGIYKVIPLFSCRVQDNKNTEYATNNKINLKQFIRDFNSVIEDIQYISKRAELSLKTKKILNVLLERKQELISDIINRAQLIPEYFNLSQEEENEDNSPDNTIKKLSNFEKRRNFYDKIHKRDTLKVDKIRSIKF